MPSAPSIVLQVAQILAVFLCAPLIKGVIERGKHIVQSKRGPSIFQPYFDYWKLLRKGSVVSEHASWIFWIAPYLAFVTPILVATLIPVLTAYPLPYAFMGDMLAGGFILGLGGFFTSLAALDTGSVFGGMGSSRARVVSLLAEPVVIVILFTVALVVQVTIPFDVNQKLASSDYLFNPAHWLLAAALFMVIMAESGRIPVDNPSSKFELSMIEHSRTLEMHFGLYNGYVAQTNKLTEELEDMNKKGQAAGSNPAYAEITRRLGFEFNGMILHEYYFGNLKAQARAQPAGDLKTALEASFGTVDEFLADFKAVGSMRGVGWAILFQDPVTGKLSNHWIQLHQNGNPAGFKPLLVMDVWEHAFLLDYKPAEKGQYMDAFISNVDWGTVSQRFSAAAAQRPVALAA